MNSKMEDFKSFILNSGFVVAEDEVDDIAKILYKGRLKGTWDFCVNRIRKKSEIETIRDNLMMEDYRSIMRKDRDKDMADDQYENDVLYRSLLRLNKQIKQKNHDIQRFQKICFELDAKRGKLKTKLMESASKNAELKDNQAKLQQFTRRVSKQSLQLEQWMETHWTNASNETTIIQNNILHFKSLIHDTLQQGTYSGDRPSIECINSTLLIKELMQETRNSINRIQSDLSISQKHKELSSRHGLETLLEDLWKQHVESYQFYESMAKQLQIYQQEITRHLDQHLSHVRDERVKRYIDLKKSLKSAETFLSCFNKQMVFLKHDNEDDLKIKKAITDRYAIIEKQSRDMSGMKLLIEDLLGYGTNHRERVSKYCYQINQQKANMVQSFSTELPTLINVNRGIASDVFKEIIHVYTISYESSIDRSGRDDRILQYNSCVNLWQKSNFCIFLERILQEKMHSRLLVTYIQEMNRFNEFEQGSPEETLKELWCNLLDERSTIDELIGKKLRKSNLSSPEVEVNKACAKLKAAIYVWTHEPAKEALITALHPTYKGKSLREWYGDMLKTNK